MKQLNKCRKAESGKKKIINMAVKRINYAIMIISVMMLVVGTLSNVSHRVLVLSYVAREMRVPYTLKMRGRVYALDNDGRNVIMINPSITVGGFYTNVAGNGEYSLIFVSGTNNKKVPVRISFFDTIGKEYDFFEEVNFNGEYEVVTDFNLNTGD